MVKKKISLIGVLISLLIGCQSITTYAYESKSIDTSDLEYKRFNPSFKSYQYIETDRNLGYRYYEFNEHLYRLMDCENWFSAKDIAEDNGGYLASITSKEENDFIYNLIINDNVYNVCFGAEDNDYDGVWEWCNGEGTICTVDEDYNVDTSFGYSNWGDGEPNSELTDNGIRESIGMFYFKYSYTWNDGVNYEKSTFITEFENCKPQDKENTIAIQVKEPFKDGYILVENSEISLLDENNNVIQTTKTDCYGYAYFDTSNVDISKCKVVSSYESDFTNGILKTNESWYCNQKELYNQFKDGCRIVTITSGEIPASENTLILDNTSYKINLAVALDSSVNIDDVKSFIENFSKQVQSQSGGEYSINEVMYLTSNDSLNYRFDNELNATIYDMCDIRISSNCETNTYGDFCTNRPIQDGELMSMLYQGIEVNPNDFQSFDINPIIDDYLYKQVAQNTD